MMSIASPLTRSIEDILFEEMGMDVIWVFEKFYDLKKIDFLG
jgi:hypothetical protein